MKKTLLFAFNLLLMAIAANGQSPGLHPYNFYDDFSSSTPYNGATWYGNSTLYSLERNGDGKLVIHSSGADPNYDSFGLYLGDTLDLSSNAFLDFNVENTSATKLTINFSLVDMNNNIAYIEKDTGDGTWTNLKRKVADTINPNSSKQVQIDLSGIYPVESWECSSPATCPKVKNDFRWDKVVGVIFQFNGGAAGITPLPLFSGDVYFRDFKLGVEPCMAVTKAILGLSTVCKNSTGVEYSVPLVEDATNYLWSLPEGAEILTGEGTNAITVLFGSKSGKISVVPSNEECMGSRRELAVTVYKPFENPTLLNGPTSACGNSEAKYYVLPSPGVTYTWHLPDGAILSNVTGSTVTVKFGNSSGDVYADLTSVCGTDVSSKITVSVTPVGEAPVVAKDGYELSSSEASYYQWYRYSEPIEGANDQTYTITYSGEYKVNTSESGCANFSNSVFAAISMLNGVNRTFVRDDFATVEPYTNVASGFPMAWWGSSVYQLTRNGDGKLKVDVTDGDPYWSSFGLQWASESTDSTLDLTNNANVHLVVENTTDQDFDFWVQLTDINGITVNVLKPEGEWELWKTIYAQALIPANTEKAVDIDLTGGIAIDWSCLCPVAFDWSKVKSVIFQTNPGAGSVFNTELFNGTLYLKDFMLGTYIEQEGSSLKATEARSYKWKRSGQAIGGANQRIYTPVQSGNYSVELEDIDGTKFESSNISFVITGVDEKQDKVYKVYPNPSDGVYNFTSEATSDVTVTDGLGRIVLTQRGSLLQLDLTSLSKGFYYLKVKQGNEEFTEKLIKY
ncbi:T9SS type A sorting domain-containing protein [Sporocytophaga myxococcoides]|uniref:T9SS type A sorting domain-containing protein n=1 Tax=Sporocytophaga myxococcoides TaxID=153721 RepID=UPI000403082D|nr:T9SS type A sorting domain-containing protein [Sporocytophaga myxococcoides]